MLRRVGSRESDVGSPGLSAVAGAYFSDTVEDADKATDALKKHADALTDIAKRYPQLTAAQEAARLEGLG